VETAAGAGAEIATGAGAGAEVAALGAAAVLAAALPVAHEEHPPALEPSEPRFDKAFAKSASN